MAYAALALLLVSACIHRPVVTTTEHVTVAASENGGAVEVTPVPGESQSSQLPTGQGRLMYTTYFYTAAEAVVHGYEANTKVRIVSMETGRPVWAGEVGAGETELVATGRGVFSFIADRKATILVGTPSTCTVVGYWARDENGGFRSDHFFVRLPASTNQGDERLIVWAWEATRVTVVDRTTDRAIYSGTIPAHGRYEIPRDGLNNLGSHVLDVRAETPTISVQVYQDEGFSVPAETGRTSGRDFLTYVGNITEGVNDLILVSYFSDVHANVQDIETGEVLFDGTLAADSIRTFTLNNRYVRVRSNGEISVMVTPFEHYQANYAEHHYSGGSEGTGIDNDFIVPTPGELWIFSYLNNNSVRVEDMRSGQEIWRGTLQAGHAQGLTPGHGLFRVRTSTAASVMGGSQACGAEFSPAGRLFEVDEALMQAVVEIRQARQQAAQERGEVLTPEAAAAPLTPSEVQRATRRVRDRTGSTVFDEAAVEERLEAMEVE
jgi:hypothetical protein